MDQMHKVIKDSCGCFWKLALFSALKKNISKSKISASLLTDCLKLFPQKETKFWINPLIGQVIIFEFNFAGVPLARILPLLENVFRYYIQHRCCTILFFHSTIAEISQFLKFPNFHLSAQATWRQFASGIESVCY